MNAGWISSTLLNLFKEKATHLQPVSDLEDRLFAGALMHATCWEDLGRVQIVSTDCYLKLQLSDVLQSQRADVCLSTDLASSDQSNVLIIDLDSLGGILKVIDQLLVMRVLKPSCMMILLSAEFSRDDFGASRLSVCDASLKLPFSFPRLELALVQADLNNMTWQDRRHRPVDRHAATQAAVA